MKIHLLIGLLLAVIVSSCTSSSERASVEQRLRGMGLQIGEGDSRIPRYSVNGWTLLDERNLIITSGVNDKYLVRLFSPCLGLDGAFYIGFTTPIGGLSRFDNIIVRSPMWGRERCNIQDIFHLEQIPA